MLEGPFSPLILSAAPATLALATPPLLSPAPFDLQGSNDARGSSGCPCTFVSLTADTRIDLGRNLVNFRPRCTGAGDTSTVSEMRTVRTLRFPLRASFMVPPSSPSTTSIPVRASMEERSSKLRVCEAGARALLLLPCRLTFTCPSSESMS